MDAIKVKMKDGSIRFIACYCYTYNGDMLQVLLEENEIREIKGVGGVWKIL